MILPKTNEMFLTLAVPPDDMLPNGLNGVNVAAKFVSNFWFQLTDLFCWPDFWY